MGIGGPGGGEIGVAACGVVRAQLREAPPENRRRARACCQSRIVIVDGIAELAKSEMNEPAGVEKTGFRRLEPQCPVAIGKRRRERISALRAGEAAIAECRRIAGIERDGAVVSALRLQAEGQQSTLVQAGRGSLSERP